MGGYPYMEVSKIGVRQNEWLITDIPFKIGDLGVAQFSETPETSNGRLPLPTQRSFARFMSSAHRFHASRLRIRDIADIETYRKTSESQDILKKKTK